MAELIYDPSVIHEFAKRLYKQASSLVLNSTILWGFLCAGGGALAALALQPFDYGPVVVAVSTLLGAIAGYNRGLEQAFRLRLEAQTALCQVQIEINTRLKEGS